MRDLTAYTCKALQELNQAHVYEPRIRHSHASGGVVSLLIRCVAPLLCFVSRLVLLEFSEATRDSSMAYANFRICNGAGASRWIVCDPLDSYAIHRVRI